MSEKRHTPLPWGIDLEINESGRSDAVGLVGGADGWTVADGWLNVATEEEGHANAEFIVRACNSHYELLEVVRKVAEHFADTDAPLGAAARAAIAKAEGK